MGNRVLLSTIGSRGDVQPLVAFALELRERGFEVRLCVPADFVEGIAGLDLEVVPIGPELRKLTTASATPPAPPTPEMLRKMIEGTVATQFETIASAAEGCDAIVGATALQIAAPSVAEKQGIPYVFAAYCPVVLPSLHHAPPPLPTVAPVPATTDIRELWEQDAQRWNANWGAALNSHRASVGLAPIEDVRGYIFTARPWLAADPALGPWPDADDESVFQPGAWMLRDERPLPREVDAFLDAGEPPVFFGFGSMRAPQDLGRTMLASARAAGRRAIVSRGWADLSAAGGDDCLAIDEVNFQALFPRVAAVVHHGGAGTTHTAARAGVPQVIVPQIYDQHYFAARVQQLGIGTAHAPGIPTAESLTDALDRTLRSEVSTRAREVAGEMRDDGAARAAERMTSVLS